jgi:hypothetical protein
MSKITTDIVVHTIAAEGENVVTMFDLHTTEADEPAARRQLGSGRRGSQDQAHPRDVRPPADPLVTGDYPALFIMCAAVDSK